MPGRLFLTRPEVSLGDQHLSDLPPRRNIAPGEEVWVLTDAGFREMRWGLIPSGRKNARGRPVLETIVNARGETVFDKSAFAGLRRAAVPADGWYEWTGQARRKQIWEITAAQGAVLWFAAIWDLWRAPNGQELAQVATVTCPPNGDVREIHDRMGVLLSPEDVALWLSEDEAAARALIRSAPDGTCLVRAVDQATLDGTG